MTLWAKGLDFKNKANSTRVGGVGVYGQDGQAQKVYLGLGHEPWNNQGLEMTSSTIKFKGNDIYHVGRKPTPAEINAADRNHNHDNLYYQKNYVDTKLNERAGNSLLSSPLVYKRFYVDGDANTYYPVLINLGNASFGFYNVNISRGFNWEAPNSWNNNTHRGGLTLSIEWTGDNSWGGNCKTYRVRNFDETYSTMVAGMQLSVNGMVVWLRGGHALYQIDTETGASVTAVVHLNGYTASDKQVYSARTNRDRVVEEIKTRENLRNGGAVYDGNQRVYSPINKPSPNDINAVNKSGDTMTGHLTVNGFTNSSNYIRLAGGNNNVLGAGTGADDVFVCNDKTQKFLQLKNDGRLCYANHEIYHQGRKPSPAEIGAVNKNGDAISGTLKFATNGNEIEIMNPSQGSQARGIVFKNNFNDNTLIGMLGGYMTDQRLEKIFIGVTSSPWDGNKALSIDKQYCYYDNKKIYHQGFKPSPAEIGALGRSERAVDSEKLRGWLLSEPSSNFRGVAFVAHDGVMEIGKYIDFHEPGKNSDYDVRLESKSGVLNCWQDFSGNNLWARKYLRINDWSGKGTDGRLYYYDDGKQMITENVEVFESKKLKAKEGGITSEGPIYAWRHNITSDKDLIFGGKCVSTIQSGGSNLYCEGRGGGTHGWHFASLDGQYADIYAKIYRQQSDARTKSEINRNVSLLNESESTLSKISKIKPREFYYSDDVNKKVLYGFFAQDLESQFPLTVTTAKYSKEDIEDENMIFPKDKDGNNIYDLKSIDPVAISAVMWDALKEVNAALEMQKIKNKELLDRIKVLEEKNK